MARLAGADATPVRLTIWPVARGLLAAQNERGRLADVQAVVDRLADGRGHDGARAVEQANQVLAAHDRFRRGR